MPKNILITGQPKSGKSFLLRRLVADIPNKVGFVTNEVSIDGKRVGFEIETFNGKKALLSHVDLKTSQKVGKYYVDITGLDSLLPEISSFKKDDLLYIDEIGEMQLFSQKFRNAVGTFLDSGNTCVATLSAIYTDDFIQGIKDRKDVTIIEITPENRDDQYLFLSDLLKRGTF